MIIDCIGCSHGYYPKLEGGDLLIVTGDLTARDEEEQYFEFCDWVSKQNYNRIIIIAGNHDNFISYKNIMWIKMLPLKATYLEDSRTEFEGLKIWGSPWTKTFPGMNPKCKAFTVDTEEELAEKWALIPDDIDILITHGPFWGMHDTVYDEEGYKDTRVGSKSLLRWISNHMDSLKLHVCSHIHESNGIHDIREIQRKLGDKEGSIYVNCSHVNERYQPVNKPIRVIL